jgi:hypothetical protein
MARCCALLGGPADELFFGCALSDPGRPGLQAGAELLQVRLDVLGDSEVDQGQTLGGSALDLIECPIPGGEVELRRRRGRGDEVVGLDPYSSRVAGVESAVSAEVGDVVTGVAGGRESL